MRKGLSLILGSLLIVGGLQSRPLAAAYAIDRVVDVATEKYAQSGRTEQERSQFQETINFFKNSSLSVFGLLGMRHFVKPTPTGKAYSAALRKSLENKAVVRDGIAYVGEKNVGRIEDMPTIRTFQKPTDPVLREEFQSDVFTREVMYQGPGTGYNYRVYQRNDIDWGLVRKNPKGPYEALGKTNLEAALKGYVPEMADGSFVQLHHIGQNGLGPLAEVTKKSHISALHQQFGINQSHPKHPVDRLIFAKDRTAYWEERGKNVSKK